MTKFLVVGIRRTGTTLVRTTLNSHPQVCCFGEVFNFGKRFTEVRGENNEHSFRQYIAGQTGGYLRDVLSRRRTVQAFLDQLFASSQKEITGFKLTMTQSIQFPVVMEYARQHDMKIVHVIRRNVLKTLISRAVKKETGFSHTRVHVNVTRVTLREHKLISELERFHNENILWKQLTEGLPYHQVMYEDYVSDKSSQLAAILNFLGASSFEHLETPYVKGNPDSIKDIVENYDAVVQTLKDTKFEWCLNDQFKS